MSLIEVYVLYVLPTTFLVICGVVLLWTIREARRRRDFGSFDRNDLSGTHGDGI